MKIHAVLGEMDAADHEGHAAWSDLLEVVASIQTRAAWLAILLWSAVTLSFLARLAGAW
jgi:hypothetical protein